MPTPSKPITSYRLSKSFQSPLDPTGSARAGGRWNSVGTPVLYLGSSQALCILELRVHTPRLLKSVPWTMCTIALPEGSVATPEELSLSLPKDWNQKPATPETAIFGDGWVAAGASLGLYVPSAVSPKDANILVNPAHAAFGQVRLVGREEFHFDARLFEGGKGPSRPNP